MFCSVKRAKASKMVLNPGMDGPPHPVKHPALPRPAKMVKNVGQWRGKLKVTLSEFRKSMMKQCEKIEQ